MKIKNYIATWFPLILVIALLIALLASIVLFQGDNSPEDSSAAELIGGYCDNRYGMVVGDGYVTPYLNRRLPNSNEIINFVEAKFDVVMLAAQTRPWYLHNKSRYIYKPEIVDKFVERMHENRDMTLMYQPLIWHNPERIGKPNDGWWDWYEKLPQSERIVALEEHVRYTVSRYRHDYRIFEVSNHAVSDGTNLPAIYTSHDNNYMLTGLSRNEVTLRALRWAREEDKNAILLVSDYLLEDDEYIRQRFINLIRYLKQNDAPLDAIGSQAHLNYGFEFNPERMKNTYDQLAELGYRIHITEFDISHDNGISDLSQPYKGFSNWWDFQAYAYEESMKIFTEHEAIDFISQRALFTNQPSMRPDIALFNPDFSPTRRYRAIRKYLMRENCKYTERSPYSVSKNLRSPNLPAGCSDVNTPEFDALSEKKQLECMGIEQ